MRAKDDLIEVLKKIMEKDTRYKIDAYLFLLSALNFTMENLKREGHVNGRELCQGIKALGIEQFGRMARTVFEHWGVRQTEDFGNIVFNMVDAGVLGKTPADSIEDFKDIFDFKKEFEDEYTY